MSGSIGGIDIRLPMGLMFTIIGVIEAIYGLMSNELPKGWPESLHVNINLLWGLVLAVFGAIMLVSARLAAKSGPKAGQP
jgi:hypothetical protein